MVLPCVRFRRGSTPPQLAVVSFSTSFLPSPSSSGRPSSSAPGPAWRGPGPGVGSAAAQLS